MFFILQLYFLTDILKVDLHIKEYFLSAVPCHLCFICSIGLGQLRSQYIFSIDASKDLEKLINCIPDGAFIPEEVWVINKANFSHFKIL